MSGEELGAALCLVSLVLLLLGLVYPAAYRLGSRCRRITSFVDHLPMAEEEALAHLLHAPDAPPVIYLVGAPLPAPRRKRCGSPPPAPSEVLPRVSHP